MKQIVLVLVYYIMKILLDYLEKLNINDKEKIIKCI